MLVALTGAGGFLGGYVAAELRRRGHRVRALVRSTKTGGGRRPDAEELQIGDQYEPAAQARFAAGADAVIQVAIDWAALHDGAIANFERNLLGTLRLLEASRLAGVRQFLFVSSMEVYHEIVPHRALDETHPAWPGSLYGAYKAAVELHLKTYHAAHGMNASAWRPATMYGLHPEPRRSLWFDLVETVHAGGEIATSDAGSLVDVRDVARALALAVGDETVAGQLYNLVDCRLEWREAAEIAKRRTGSAASIQVAGRADAGPVFDATKARAFFAEHGEARALRGGLAGVEQYVASLLAQVQGGADPSDP